MFGGRGGSSGVFTAGSGLIVQILRILRENGVLRLILCKMGEGEGGVIAREADDSERLDSSKIVGGEGVFDFFLFSFLISRCNACNALNMKF